MEPSTTEIDMQELTQTQHDASQIIKAIGGAAKVGREFGITRQAVSRWKKNGIPHAWKIAIGLKYPDVVKNAIGGNA